MAPNGNSLGLDAEDEEQARTHESVGYDPELDDEYDGERPVNRDEAERENETVDEAGHEARHDTEAEAEAEGEEEPDRLAGYASVPPSEFDNAPANVNADAYADEDAEDGEAADYLAAPEDVATREGESVEPAESVEPVESEVGEHADPYRLGSPIPGHPNSGPVLVVPESADDAEAGLEHEAGYRQEPQIVGAAADDFADDGRDEVDGRAEFDQAVGAEEVAGYELAEETAAQSQPAVQVGDTGSQPLLSAETQDELLQRWTAIQVSFVDNPAESVRSAEALIGDIGTAIQEAIQARADQISGSWQGSTDTEQLRLSLQEYRSFLSVVLPK